jgi:lipopolysaccharide biosynthesis regulator YciM
MGAALLLLLLGLGALAAGILVGRYYVPDDRLLRRTARHARAYMRTINHLLARDSQTAVDELRKVVEENVEDVEPYFALGALFRNRGEHERAIRVHQALAVREQDSKKLRMRARYELGMDFRAAGMPRRATRAMEECLADEPKHEGALRALCGLYEEQGRYAEAAQAWTRLAKARGEVPSRREHHLLVAAAQRSIASGDPDSAKRFLKDAQKIDGESPHFLAAAAELAAARRNFVGASARLCQALEKAPDLARFLVPGLVEAHRQIAEGAAVPAPPPSAAAAGPEPAAAAAPEPDTEADIEVALVRQADTAIVKANGHPALKPDATLEQRAAAGAVKALEEVLAHSGDNAHLRLAIAELRAHYDRPAALSDYRAAAAKQPDLLAARVAAARLALAEAQDGVVARELRALAGVGGALAWAFDGVWRCGRCAQRSDDFFWRCASCRRWGTSQLDVGRAAQMPLPPPPRERREAARLAPELTLLGASADHALPEPTLESGLSADALVTAGKRPSLLGRVGGWISGTWSGMRGAKKSSTSPDD